MLRLVTSEIALMGNWLKNGLKNGLCTCGWGISGRKLNGFHISVYINTSDEVINLSTVKMYDTAWNQWISLGFWSE